MNGLSQSRRQRLISKVKTTPFNALQITMSVAYSPSMAINEKLEILV